MMSPTALAKNDVDRRARSGAVLLLVLTVSALFYYKWGGSLRVLGKVNETGRLALSPQALLDGGLVATTRFYFGKIWPALAYGLLVGAAVQATVPTRWVKRWLGAGSGRPTVLGALVGAPLMLCSCCVTPIFSGLYSRGARLGPSLAVMLASPGLNLAALVLTFTLLPMRVAMLRLGAAAVIVLAVPAIVGRVMRSRTVATEGDACPLPESGAADEAARDPNEDGSLRATGIRFVKSIVTMAAITVPLIVIGVVFSGLLMPYVTKLTAGGIVLSVALVALVGVVVALPTFFEIPIALMLLAAGAPHGVAVAFVVAGPIVNLASLFVLGRETQPRVALAVAAGVWLVATTAGLVAGF
jgi:uncharacterized membrane protein YraQ (UPF0718 family)